MPDMKGVSLVFRDGDGTTRQPRSRCSVSHTIMRSSDTVMLRIEDAKVCGRAGVTPPGPDGSRGESYPLSAPAPDAREGRRVPGGLSGGHRAVAEDRDGPTGVPARPGGRRPFAAGRRAILTVAQWQGTVQGARRRRTAHQAGSR